MTDIIFMSLFGEILPFYDLKLQGKGSKYIRTTPTVLEKLCIIQILVRKYCCATRRKTNFGPLAPFFTNNTNKGS